MDCCPQRSQDLKLFLLSKFPSKYENKKLHKFPLQIQNKFNYKRYKSNTHSNYQKYIALYLVAWIGNHWCRPYSFVIRVFNSWRSPCSTSYSFTLWIVYLWSFPFTIFSVVPEHNINNNKIPIFAH